MTDASGALVPNAQITLTNQATNQIREAVSNTAGAYRFANVGIGTYTLAVTAQGFQKYTKTGIVVNVAQTVEENVTPRGRQPGTDRDRGSGRIAGADRDQRSEHADQRPAGVSSSPPTAVTSLRWPPSAWAYPTTFPPSAASMR